MKPKLEKTKRPVTMAQVASYAKVSLGTVSHVLNGTATVREELRSKVERAVEALGYRPSQLARGLSRSKTNLVGLIVPDVAHPLFHSIVRGAEDVAFRRGYQLVLCNADNKASKELSYLESLSAFRPAGLLVVPCDESVLAKKLKREPKAVFLDRTPAGWTGDIVLVNNEMGGYQAGRHLLDMGHRSLAVIVGPHAQMAARQRLAGFQRALREVRLRLGSERIEQSPLSREGGLVAAQRLLALSPRPTAIFAASDAIAAGVLTAIRRQSLRCPEDVSVVGFGDVAFAALTSPGLTTVHVPSYQMGAIACQILLAAPSSAQGPQAIYVDTTLKMRESVKVMELPRMPPGAVAKKRLPAR